MSFRMSSKALGWAAFSTFLASCSPVLAQDAQLTKALGYAPRQNDVRYDKVATGDLARCTGKIDKRSGIDGYLVSSPNGIPLRWFADTNGDKSVDQWSYFADGIEVYRDMDTDFNGVADEYRWLGTSGTRWGVDSDEDGKIDRWKTISAEEVTMEVVEAVRSKDNDRFRRLLLSPDELTNLGLGEEKAGQLEQRLKTASSEFSSFTSSQKLIGKDSKWANFGADKPGLIPAGTDGSTADLVAYENTLAVLEDGNNKPQQLFVGTLIQVGSAWRLVDLPKVVGEGNIVQNTGVFFSASTGSRTMGGGATAGGLAPKIEALMAELEKVDAKLNEATGDKSALHSDRADVLERLITATSDETERSQWIRQFADTVGVAVQSGDFPDGIERLNRLKKALAANKSSKQDAAYVSFRTISSEYIQQVGQPKADFATIQKEYLTNLETFVTEYPDSDDAAEALVQIGLSKELEGEATEAIRWYTRAAKDFPKTLSGRKAGNAAGRMELTGKKMQLKGQTLDGKAFDLSAYAQKVVVIHCWASWCEPCKADMKKLRQLQATHARSKNLAIVGINVDDTADKAKALLNQEKFPWVQLYQAGGMESDMAVALGVISLPITIVVDESGKVVSSSTHFSPDVEKVVDNLLTPPAPAPAANKKK